MSWTGLAQKESTQSLVLSRRGSVFVFFGFRRMFLLFCFDHLKPFDMHSLDVHGLGSMFCSMFYVPGWVQNALQKQKNIQIMVYKLFIRGIIPIRPQSPSPKLYHLP